jgi:hypothetical protein
MKNILCLAVLFFLFGCKSISNVVEMTGRALDGSSFEYKIVSLWQPLTKSGLDLRKVTQKDGSNELVFTNSDLPYLTFYSSLPDNNGIFYITRVHFLAGNYGGWNEFTAEAHGTGRLRKLGVDNIAFTVLGKIELFNITNGAIRKENTRIYGDRAVEALRNRNERILYLTGWMRKDSTRPKVFFGQNEFESYWNDKLFLSDDSQMIELRDSGALDADWNEAASWIYTEYDFDKLTSVLNREVYLYRVK